MTSHIPLDPYVVTVLVFITAGLSYAFIGYKAKMYKYFKGDPAVTFDPRKIAKTFGLGVFLGIVALVAEEATNGVAVVDITDIGVFIKQVGFTMGFIYTIDKLMIAGNGGTKKTGGHIADTSAPRVIGVSLGSDDDDESDIDPAEIADDALDPPVIDTEPPNLEEVTK